MNQQRSRRFRSARDLAQSKKAAMSKGLVKDSSTIFDSNCITPGTEFMVEVATHLKYFLRRKVKEDVVWRQCEVIFSGPDVPGEGEHKIMEYIRNSKMSPEYNPNTRHICYGLDADLVMLR